MKLSKSYLKKDFPVRASLENWRSHRLTAGTLSKRSCKVQPLLIPVLGTHSRTLAFQTAHLSSWWGDSYYGTCPRLAASSEQVMAGGGVCGGFPSLPFPPLSLSLPSKGVGTHGTDRSWTCQGTMYLFGDPRVRLRPLNAFSQVESTNQEFGKIESTLPVFSPLRSLAGPEVWGCSPHSLSSLSTLRVPSLFQSGSIHILGWADCGKIRRRRMMKRLSQKKISAENCLLFAGK